LLGHAIAACAKSAPIRQPAGRLAVLTPASGAGRVAAGDDAPEPLCSRAIIEGVRQWLKAEESTVGSRRSFSMRTKWAAPLPA
jgi:hypothetical protein